MIHNMALSKMLEPCFPLTTQLEQCRDVTANFYWYGFRRAYKVNGCRNDVRGFLSMLVAQNFVKDGSFRGRMVYLHLSMFSIWAGSS